MELAGRWSLLPRRGPGSEPEPASVTQAHLETRARAYLRRYGVVFRRVIQRERHAPPWRDLVRVYRRLEARGDVRGGRFVSGFTGEQFALPEALQGLRDLRDAPPSEDLVGISAVDPLNLVGLLTPGDRVPAHPGNRILFRDGEPVAVLEGQVVRALESAEPSDPPRDPEPPRLRELEEALLRQPLPPRLRPFYR